MSVVDLRQYAIVAACQTAGKQALDCHTAFDGPFGPEPVILSAAEREEVVSILTQVALSLSERSEAMPSLRRRLGAVVEALIAVADALDGDCDLEDGADQEVVCEDEGAQCEDEGSPNDNGIADADGRAEQLPGVHFWNEACV
ncbi:conserved hypothetical protein [Hyphomicrobiales bacterium]|nr:conserved hypothetical protein [Hyphomicrobiales bacterium]CAH1697281.1 conserved hypothetical protein [Hyphomicrobiales bacterium]CAI0342848.1 conserved hypothetical protein [Hyphomicrobiales bacterium]